MINNNFQKTAQFFQLQEDYYQHEVTEQRQTLEKNNSENESNKNININQLRRQRYIKNQQQKQFQPELTFKYQENNPQNDEEQIIKNTANFGFQQSEKNQNNSQGNGTRRIFSPKINILSNQKASKLGEKETPVFQQVRSPQQQSLKFQHIYSVSSESKLPNIKIMPNSTKSDTRTQQLLKLGSFKSNQNLKMQSNIIKHGNCEDQSSDCSSLQNSMYKHNYNSMDEKNHIIYQKKLIFPFNSNQIKNDLIDFQLNSENQIVLDQNQKNHVIKRQFNSQFKDTLSLISKMSKNHKNIALDIEPPDMTRNANHEQETLIQAYFNRKSKTADQVAQGMRSTKNIKLEPIQEQMENKQNKFLSRKPQIKMIDRIFSSKEQKIQQIQ